MIHIVEAFLVLIFTIAILVWWCLFASNRDYPFWVYFLVSIVGAVAGSIGFTYFITRL